MNKIIRKLANNKTLFSNFSYLALLEIFVLIAPLITYPYLVRVLGKELYGWVITAQITASYATILIDFGFRRVSAKFIASCKEDLDSLSRVVSTVLTLRAILWILTLVLYILVIILIPSYKSQLPLFLFSYGLTISSVLLPDFYFQGVEQMKYITFVNIITRSVFIVATFFLITTPEQYVWVPVLWSCGYILGGLYSLYIVFVKHGIKLVKPRHSDFKLHLKETTPIFCSDVMINIKDKFGYNLMGGMLGMSDVVIYDIGTKIVNLLSKPTMIFSTVVFPRMSLNPSVSKTKKIFCALICLSVIMVGIVYLFLPNIVKFFINDDIDLFALRIYLLAPILTGISFYIPSSVFVAFGKNKYVFYSTIFSTISYFVILVLMWKFGYLTSVLQFIILTVLSYFVETMFRLLLSQRIFSSHKLSNP